MYSKLQDLMKEKQFYSALKTLEQLEHIYLPRVRGYIFSEALAKEIPNMRQSIENQSKAELKVSKREKERHMLSIVSWCIVFLKHFAIPLYLRACEDFGVQIVYA